MIASINDTDMDTDDNMSQARRNRRNRPPARPSAQTQMAAVDMLQTINTAASQTAASLLINDITPNKTESLKILSTQSVGARSLLEPMQANASTIKLNRIETVNVLDFLGSVYDNTIQVIVTE
ncbi:AcOrf-102 [Autographa californica nucleopolyhedrovirus]|uniref:Protein Ac102 n=2 Tax=Autographa californica nuclear polyhedrosis virus TaxID=46015 RepID=AC102_NPVAC|nr:AcOrf-102 [Autographa californica nucleopolyhedrovirus]P41482.1 RecName: Full=Protein Ac102; AltName: Full=P12 [Autographa californica nucleopolyhedrovirus]AKN58954.1 AcOrf-102 [Autographa californica multiple nucleopolyhedrovirus]ARJ58786.1 Orf-102 [synthetic baculovirus AcMNPV-WIV-Syn1]UVY87367.1 p12 [synthetic construct]AAA66732.1 AcOrf-102 [Autographa californica nucleopolyhedrovirus]AAB08768.1 p12 [Autographa californica nucleopolyhedrovirus]